MRFLELRGKKLISIILLTSGLDFLLFGCEYSSPGPCSKRPRADCPLR